MTKERATEQDGAEPTENDKEEGLLQDADLGHVSGGVVINHEEQYSSKSIVRPTRLDKSLSRLPGSFKLRDDS